MREVEATKKNARPICFWIAESNLRTQSASLVLTSSSMMRYLVKFRDGLDGGHHPVTYKNVRLGNLSFSILATACSNSDWK